MNIKISNQNLTISQAQQKVDEWIKSIGVKYFSELTNTAILMEEVGELARIMAIHLNRFEYRQLINNKTGQFFPWLIQIND